MDNKVVKDLALAESDNIKNALSEDITIIETLKNITKFSRTLPIPGQNNSDQSLENLLLFHSPYERFPYYKDKIDTVDYIRNSVNKPYSFSLSIDDIQSEANSDVSTNKKDKYEKDINQNFITYKADEYRNYVYPFNSDTYLSYIKVDNPDGVNLSDMQMSNQFNLETTENRFVTTYRNPTAWVNPQYQNLFYYFCNVNLYISFFTTKVFWQKSVYKI
mgnify:CR=1 FL=1